MLTNTKESFGLISRSIQWLVLILFFMVTLGGLRTSELEEGVEKLDMIFMHKSVGIMILTLMLFQIICKILNPTPVALSSDVKSNRVSTVIQFLLMTLMIAQPVIGIMMSQAAGSTVSPFGFFDLPVFTDVDKSYAKTLQMIHERLWVVIIGLILIDLSGSLKQYFVLINRTLVLIVKDWTGRQP